MRNFHKGLCKGLIMIGMLSFIMTCLESEAEEETTSPVQFNKESPTRYVTDSFTITMRKGSGTTFRVVKMLETGSALKIIESNDAGWSHVRTKEGLEGWVLTRFLSDKLPARARVDQAEHAHRNISEERDQLMRQLTTLQERFVDQEALEKEVEQMRELSSNAAAIQEENQALQTELVLLRKKIQAISEEKRTLEQHSETQFFLAGAGVLILGMISGTILSRSSRTRRRSHNRSGLLD